MKIMQTMFAKALELAKERLLNKKLKNKQNYDTNTINIDLKIDDLVLVKSQVKKHKFQDVYEGPFKVVDVFDSYIEILKNGKRTKIHKNLVKKSQTEHENGSSLSSQVANLNSLNMDLIQKINYIYNIKIQQVV